MNNPTRTAGGAIAVDGSMISEKGLLLLGYQRTKNISRKARLSWEAGDPSVIEAEVAARGAEIFAGAVSEIESEHQPLREAMQKLGMAPKTMVEIGCGQGIGTLLLYRDFGCHLTLVDIEETPDQYHGWNDKGAGYAALSETSAFLKGNGVPAKNLKLINPRKTPGAVAGLKADLVVSFFSCGFHYPIADYADLMCETVAKGGAVVLDLRLRYLSRPDADLRRLMQVGKQTEVSTIEKSKRILFHL